MYNQYLKINSSVNNLNDIMRYSYIFNILHESI